MFDETYNSLKPFLIHCTSLVTLYEEFYLFGKIEKRRGPILLDFLNPDLT